MKSFVILLLFGLLCVQDSLCLTEAQVKSTVKLMRNTCQPKSKATDEQIEGMHKGAWNFEKPAMCYVFCWMKTMKVVTPEGKIDLESALKQIGTMPPARQAPTQASFEKCAPIVAKMDITEKCETAYQFAKCFYENDPANYFFP